MPTSYLITARRVITTTASLRPGYILVIDEFIAKVGEGEVPDGVAGSETVRVTCDTIIPGLVDIHNHGLCGAPGDTYFTVEKTWHDPLPSLARLASYGVTSVLATLLLAASDNGLLSPCSSSAVSSIAAYAGHCPVSSEGPSCVRSLEGRSGSDIDVAVGAVIEGVHAEGPFVTSLGGLPSSTLALRDRLLDSLRPAAHTAARPMSTSVTVSEAAPCCSAFDDFLHSLIAPHACSAPCVGNRPAHLHSVLVQSKTAARAAGAAAKPLCRIMTVAPSLDSPEYSVTRALVASGIKVALGHDLSATPAQVTGCLAAALWACDGCASPPLPCHVTHLFNVMQLHHRNAGLCNVALLPRLPQSLMRIVEAAAPAAGPGRSAAVHDSRLTPTVEIIGDFKHVCREAVALALLSRGPSSVAMVSDAVAAPTAPPPWKQEDLPPSPGGGSARTILYGCNADGTPRQLDVRNGAVYIDESTLAGSCVTLWQCLQNLLQLGIISEEEAVACVSAVPAKVAGLDHVGALVEGKVASLVLVDADISIIEGVMVYGRWLRRPSMTEAN